MKKTVIISVAVVTAVILTFIIVPFITCDDNDLVGQWVKKDYNGIHNISFKRNGTGVQNVDGEEHEFRWTAENGVITMKNLGEELGAAPFPIEYRVEGDRLIITEGKYTVEFFKT